MPITPADIVSSGLVSERDLAQANEAALALFAAGSGFAEKNGLILVDTKYEMGKVGDKLILIDEVHTADSSRFWVKDGYQAAFDAGEAPQMLDKERLRRWLREERDYMGNGPAPELTDDVRTDLAVHYWDLTERLLGQPFVPPEEAPQTRVAKVLRGIA